MQISRSFPNYENFSPRVPVWCVTPERPACIHRFFDTSPISPSGRYVALFQLPALSFHDCVCRWCKADQTHKGES